MRLACLYGAIHLAGCAEWVRQNREAVRVQHVKDRAEDIVWKDLVPKYEFQHSCEEVGDVVVQFLIEQGYDIATQSKTQIVTAKKYSNEGGRYDPPDRQQTRVVTTALRSTGAGCRIEATGVDRYGTNISDTARAPNVELKAIEKLEPERAEAMKAEATRRAEAENPPEKPVETPVAGAPAGNEKAADASAERTAPPPSRRERKPPEHKAAAVTDGEDEQPSGPMKPAAPAENVITPAPAASPMPAPAKGAQASSRPWYFWSAVTATALFGAGAVVTGLSANSKFNDLENSCGRTSAGCSPEQIDAVKSRATVANVLWILAGASGVVTGITFFVRDREAGASIALRF